MVKWTPAVAQPGAEPVVGYQVTAVAPANAAGNQPTTGLRLGAGATTATLTGLDPNLAYTIEVRSILSGGEMSVPFAPASGPADTTLPTLTLSPAGGAAGAPIETSSVTVTSNGQVFFTTDGIPAMCLGDALGDLRRRIRIRQQAHDSGQGVARLRWAAVADRDVPVLHRPRAAGQGRRCGRPV